MAQQNRTEAHPSAGVTQLLGGLAIIVMSVCMLVGAFLLSKVDISSVAPSPVAVSATPAAPLPSATPSLLPPTATPSATPSPTAIPPTATATSTPSPQTTVATDAPTATPSATRPPATPTPTRTSLLPTVCYPPANWVAYTVQRGDTLTSLALRTRTTVPALMQANCLRTSLLLVGQRLYVPSLPYVTPPPTPPCGPPAGWVIYTVQAGDTLYSLAQRTGTTVEALRQANCLPDYTIRIGQRLYLPRLPLPTLSPTPTVTRTPSPTPTNGVTVTPTNGVTATPTNGVTATPTNGVTPTATPIPPTPTFTPTPTAPISPLATR